MDTSNFLQDRDRLARIGVLLGTLFILFFVGRFLLHVITSGTLVVTTGSKADSIAVSSAPIQRGPERSTVRTTKKGTGTLALRVRADSYIVSVQNGTLQTSERVSIGWLGNKTVNLKPYSAVSPDVEPVSYESVQNIAADSSQMIYLNNDFNGIEYINTANETSQIAENQYFTSVAWANADYGLAQDTSGKLYVIDNNAAQPLKSPISKLSDVSGTIFAIAPDRTIYIGLGTNVYRGTASGSFKQIYSKLSAGESLVAANGKVMIMNPGIHGQNGTAVVISTNGNEFRKNFGYAVGGWTPWSPGGKYIVISVGTTPELFNSSLKQVDTVPQATAINDGAWLNDNVLFYYSGGKIWSYNISQKLANNFANLPGQQIIVGITVSTDGSYVYVTASDSSDLYPRAIFRVGLKGQQVPSYINTLVSVLPINTSTYSVGLFNFSGTPVINITTYPGTDEGGALQETQQTIQNIIGTNNVTYNVKAGD